MYKLFPLGYSLFCVIGSTFRIATDSILWVLCVHIIFSTILIVHIMNYFLDTTIKKMQASKLVIGFSLLSWYILKIIISSSPEVFHINLLRLFGAVIPGIILGSSFASFLNKPQTLNFKGMLVAGSKYLPSWGFILTANALVVSLIALYLLRNTMDEILFISENKLKGVGSFQMLSDFLIIHLSIFLLTAQRLSNITELCSVAKNKHYHYLVLIMLVSSSMIAVVTGSNKLILFVAVLSTFYLVYLITKNRSVVTNSVIFLFSILTIITIIYLFEQNSITSILSNTRILDYGGASSILDTPSIASRLHILQNCVPEQLRLSPLLGDLGAEFKVCGDGFYAHSLLSVQTHLGLIGTLLTTTLIIFGFSNSNIWRDHKPILFTYVLILSLAVLSAFFTWLPFWFILSFIVFFLPTKNTSIIIKNSA